MPKKYMILTAASAALLAAGAVFAIILSNSAGSAGQSSTPEFVMPESSQSTPPESTSTVQSAGTSINSGTAASSGASTGSAVTRSAPEEVSEPEITTSAAPATSRSTADTPFDTASAAKSDVTSAGTAVTSTSPATSTNSAAAVDTPSEPEHIPDNVLVTSGDPLHYIRFEFQKDRVDYSGVYSGDKITDLRIFRPKIISEPSASGDSFSGSIDVSSLTPGFYIIVARLESGAGMYYVFEMTGDGAAAVPADSLPAASNLAFMEAPLMLPEEGVLQHVTATGDRERAARILSEIQTLSDRICAGLTSDYDKVRALAQWVSLNMYYDKDAQKNGVTDEEITLDFVLENHRSVCFGWSNLYSALCQAQGIKCYNASGSVVTGSRCFLQTETSDERSHSWNLVELDGRLIWVDTVWDSSNTYEKSNYFTSSQDMQYFDIDNTLLSHDHRVTRLEYRDYFAIS